MVASNPSSPWEDVLTVGGRVLRFAHRHLLAIITVVIILSLAVSVWKVVAAYRNRTVILYTASPTADSSLIGEAIRKHFANNPPSWLVSYKIELRPSEGLKENRRLVAESSPEQLVIGFDQDGFNPPNNVRTLIPLTELYLHIITLQTSVREAQESEVRAPVANAAVGGGVVAAEPPAKPAPMTLNRMIRYFSEKNKPLKLPRFFLGPEGSGSRQLAEQVLARYGMNTRYSDFGDHISWDTAYRMLASGEIDIIFDASDMGSPNITRLAMEGDRYQLLGLDNVEAMAAGENRFMRPRKIPAGSYSTTQTFCPTDIYTVSTQRTIVCHQKLSTFDAYYLTAGIREAVRGAVPTIPWDRPEPPQQNELICPLHEGAIDYRHDRQPLVWLNTILEKHWFTAITAVIGLVYLLYRRRMDRKSGSGPNPDETTPAPSPPISPPPAEVSTTALVPLPSGREPLSEHHPPPALAGRTSDLLPSLQGFLNECVEVFKQIEKLKGERRPPVAVLHKVEADLKGLGRTHAELVAEFGPDAQKCLEFQRLSLERMNADLTQVFSRSHGRAGTNGRNDSQGHRTRN